MNLQLSGSVGRGGENRGSDIKLIRALLNVHRRQQSLPPLVVDIIPGADLDAAIARFQSDRGVNVASGLVGKGSQTWIWLNEVLANSRTRVAIVPPSMGALTWAAEGQEGGRYHSRILHVPSASSGLTVGRGYDLKERSRVEVTQHLSAAGLSAGRASTIAGAARLSGAVAEQFIIDSDLLDFEISAAVQLQLFEKVYREMEQDVIRICNKRDVKERYGVTDWNALDSRIKDALVDLRFRGDYTGTTRRQVQPPVVANDLDAFRKVISDGALWTNVPADRFQRRVRYLA